MYRKKLISPRVAVIGCGIFGSLIALRLAEKGAKVSVYERLNNGLLGASANNQNRLHLGFHYPRDDLTALQCIKGFGSFRTVFEDSILESFPNAYFIANSGSLTTPTDYLEFCKRLNLSYELINLDDFFININDVALGVMTNEVVYDCNILRKNILNKLSLAKVFPNFNCEITKISYFNEQFTLIANNDLICNFDYVVNCTYANINFLTAQLGYEVPVYQYEYTIVPIIEWNQDAVGLTIMDGKYMTVLPYGKSGKFLLYHVEHTVIASVIADQIPFSWLNPETSPSKDLDLMKLFEKIIFSCAKFIPNLISAKLVGFLQGPRVVLANRDNTDARPSIINHYDSGYFSVFTGKIDHCIWVADDIASTIFEA